MAPPKNLIISILTIIVGSSFQFGFHTGACNNIKILLENFIKNVTFERSGEVLTDDTVNTLYSVVTGLFMLGGIFGGLSSGILANKFGRKRSMLLLSIPSILGSLLMVLGPACRSYEVVMVGRFIVGLASGAYSGLSPLYLSEIAPQNLSGAVGTLNQLTIVTAILISQFFGLPQVLGQENSWNYIFIFSIAAGLVQLALMPLVPDSPRYLLSGRKNLDDTLTALKFFRNTPDVDEEMTSLRRDAERTDNLANISIIGIFKDGYFRKLVLICVLLHFTQQLSGINGIILYSTSIFRSAGMTDTTATLATMGTGGVNLLGTVLAAFLIERTGRKSLMLYGTWGVQVFCCVLTFAMLEQDVNSSADAWSVVAIICIFGFVAFFAVGPGAIPWFYVGEVFTIEACGAAVTFCTAINWSANIAIAFGFPQLITYLNNLVFLPFAILLTLFALLIMLFMVESRGKSPEELRRAHLMDRSQSHNLLVHSVQELSTDVDYQTDRRTPALIVTPP